MKCFSYVQRWNGREQEKQRTVLSSIETIHLRFLVKQECYKESNLFHINDIKCDSSQQCAPEVFFCTRRICLFVTLKALTRTDFGSLFRFHALNNERYRDKLRERKKKTERQRSLSLECVFSDVVFSHRFVRKLSCDGKEFNLNVS